MGIGGSDENVFFEEKTDVNVFVNLSNFNLSPNSLMEPKNRESPLQRTIYAFPSHITLPSCIKYSTKDFENLQHLTWKNMRANLVSNFHHCTHIIASIAQLISTSLLLRNAKCLNCKIIP